MKSAFADDEMPLNQEALHKAFLEDETRNRNAIKLIAARAGIHWAGGQFDAQKSPFSAPKALLEASTVPSPCISVCQMDEITGLCQGCFRDIGEIAAWGNADTEERLVIWRAILQRVS